MTLSMTVNFANDGLSNDVDQGAPSCAVRTQQAYLSDRESGISTALRSSLRELFRQSTLPDNPAYFLANVLSAFYDRSSVWTIDGSMILREVDSGSAKVSDTRRRLCTLGDNGYAWGMPHIVRCLSVRGMAAIHEVLTHSLHASFFRASVPFQTDASGYLARTICSLLGSTAMYKPAWQAFPELKVRADVLISAPAVDDAFTTFAQIIFRDIKAIEQMALNIVLRAEAQDTAQSLASAGAVVAKKQSAVRSMTGAEIQASPPDFFLMVKKAVLARKVRRRCSKLLAASRALGACAHACMHAARIHVGHLAPSAQCTNACHMR